MFDRPVFLSRLSPRTPIIMIVQRLHDEAIHTLSAMIVDADAASVRHLKTVFKAHPQIAVGCTARTIATAISQAEKHRPDVVFLDVEMADGERFAMTQQLAPGRAIVVVSDRPDFAFSAFELGAIDYLLKPVSVERLRMTLRRLDRLFFRSSELLADMGTESSPARLTSVDRVPIPSQRADQRKSTDLVPVNGVIWVESLQNYSVVQLPGRDRRTIKRSLSEWAALLPEREFVRIGRSHLIQIAKIKSITSPRRNEVLVSFHGVEQPLRVGRAASSKLKGILRGAFPA
jgi:two-component system LytT family response regulator